jgi:hypothetical protein
MIAWKEPRSSVLMLFLALLFTSSTGALLRPSGSHLAPRHPDLQHTGEKHDLYDELHGRDSRLAISPSAHACLNVRGGGVIGIAVALVRTVIQNPLLILCTYTRGLLQVLGFPFLPLF